ncbi:MAG: four helix bundle protein [Verrucomicrobia bacterium]|nr:MAG: four helix bundle protein [Verrucomicrobiota bacterium]
MKTAFERLEVYRLSEQLADAIWDMALSWDRFAKSTVGRPLVKAADSIGAKIAAGQGRGADAENRRLVRAALGSLNETQHWLRRAFRRDLNGLQPLARKLGPRLKAHLKSIRRDPADPPAD